MTAEEEKPGERPDNEEFVLHKTYGRTLEKSVESTRQRFSYEVSGVYVMNGMAYCLA